MTVLELQLMIFSQFSLQVHATAQGCTHHLPAIELLEKRYELVTWRRRVEH